MTSPWQKHLDTLDNNPQQINETVDLFAKQLSDVLETKQTSECVMYAPRYGSCLDKKTGVARMLAFKLFPIKKEEERQWAFISYNQLISKLKRQHRFKIQEEKRTKDQQEKLKKQQEMISGTCKLPLSTMIKEKHMWCTLKKKPLSDQVVNPKAMPVDVAPLGELEPFFAFLSGNTNIDTQMIEFKRGVFYDDGRIDLCKQVVGPPWISKLMDSIKENKHVEHFLLGNNIIDLPGAKAISQFILQKHVPKIKTWYLAGNCIDEEGAGLLAEAFKVDKDSDALWLKRNPVKPVGAKHLAEMLKVNTTLEILDMHNTGVLDEGTKYLFEGLKSNTTLKHLYMDANGITIEGAKYIAEYFNHKVKNNEPGIESLWLDMNRLEDDGAIIISQALKDYPIRKLIMGSNRITSIGAKVICDSFVDHKTLQLLDLGIYKATADIGELANDIGDNGVNDICNLIINNQKLQFLSVLHNGFTSDGMKKLHDAVLKNNNLLEFQYEQFGLLIDKDVKKNIDVKIKQNIDTNLGMDFKQFLLERRSMKHFPKIRYIDSIYRNNM